MTLPPRLKKKKRREQRIRCPGHLAFVRSFACCVPNCRETTIEAAHVRTGTDGGLGLKPSDFWAVSLCVGHHAQQHGMGEAPFEQRHGIDLKALAQEFAAKSPHRKKWAAQ